MRFSTKLLTCVIILFTSFSFEALAQCASGKYYPKLGDPFSGWTASNYPMIIEMDAEKLTDTSFPKTAAEDGQDENLDYKGDYPRNPVGSGLIPLKLYDYDINGQHDSGKLYYIKYHNCVFAPEHYTSSYVKVLKNDISNISGCGRTDQSNGCEKNDNSVFKRGVYSKKGFIEINRQGSTEAEGSKHGYIQLDGLRGVEKIQWSFSSTAWKRGVICEYRENNGDWKTLRSIPSNTSFYATFAEQGYEFEENFGYAQDMDEDTELSIRFRIWDGDDTTFEDYLDYPVNERPSDFYYKAVDPYAQWQVVRIHQIRVYSFLNGSELAATSVENNEASTFCVYKSGNNIYSTKDSQIEIYTIDGKLAKKQFGNQINVSDLNKGIYVVKATGLDGTVQNTKISL